MADGMAALSPEIKQAFDKYQNTVEEFKSKNDQRLEGIEKKFDDVVSREQVDKLNAALDELKANINESIAELKKSHRAQEEEAPVDEKKAALMRLELGVLDEFVRHGQKAGYAAADALEAKAKELGFEKKDLSTVILQDGGIAVRPEWEAEMIEIIEEISEVRHLVRVMQSGTATKKVLVDKGGAAAAWADELEERVRTAHAQLEEREFVANELYALNFITETMKEDAVFDIHAWMIENATESMERAEGAAVINGNGVKKPKGILAQTIVANADWQWGKLGYILTGKAGGFADAVPGSAVGSTSATNGADVLFDVIHSVKKAYRKNGTWVLNRLTLGEIRKLKDAEGNYLFKDALTANGFLSMLLGYELFEAEDMPDIDANSYSIAFGDFYRGYWMIDRIGMSMKRDDITQPQFDKVYLRRRVGGDVADYQAIKLVKFGTA